MKCMYCGIYLGHAKYIKTAFQSTYGHRIFGQVFFLNVYVCCQSPDRQLIQRLLLFYYIIQMNGPHSTFHGFIFINFLAIAIIQLKSDGQWLP